MSKKIIDSFEKDIFVNFVKNSHSWIELSKKLNLKFFNGKIKKNLEQKCLDFNCDTNHFDPHKKLKELRIYEKINKNCPICNSVFETLKDHKKEKITCSTKCSNKFFSSSKHSDESNEKRRQKLTFKGPIQQKNIILSNRQN